MEQQGAVNRAMPHLIGEDQGTRPSADRSVRSETADAGINL